MLIFCVSTPEFPGHCRGIHGHSPDMFWGIFRTSPLNLASITPYAYDKKTPNFAQGLDFLRSQVAIYTVFHEESESEVKNKHFLEPGGTK